MSKEAQCRRDRIALALTETRLADLEAHGTAALSTYDREIAHGGDAERALFIATRLVRNQRAHFAREVAHCDEPAHQTTLFDAGT